MKIDSCQVKKQKILKPALFYRLHGVVVSTTSCNVFLSNTMLEYLNT